MTNVRCLVEDDLGRIYAGTVAGVVRLTPETSALRHFTFADGLRGDFVLSAARDAKGRLWFGSMTGLSCLTPGPDPQSPRAQVLIERVTASGRSIPIAARGATGIDGLLLSAGQRDLSVRFGAVASRPGERLAYQVQLDGGPWSAPGPERSVSFVSLDPGSHQLLVRVAGSANVASLQFDAAAAFAERPVVRVGALALFGLAVALLARYRITKALELERTRLSIASDLHDGLGSGLARLSILAELARAEAPPGGAPLLDEIGRTARAVAESLSDHVWAIDPGRDLVRTLSDRLARVSRELLEPLGIALTLDLPGEAVSLLPLPPAVRRHALLVGKEALLNAARHSGATRVRLRLALEASRLVLEVEDDGSGIEKRVGGEASGDGHGLDSMRRRAAALGATLRVSRAPAGGTLVSFSVSV